MSMMLPEGMPPPRMMGGPPPPPPPEQTGGGSYEDALRTILDLVRAATALADDDKSALTMEKVSSLLQTDLADQQKETEGMLQGKMSPRLMRQAYSGG